MAKKMLIDATHPEETRVVVVDGNKVEEFDFETVNKRQIAGNIYLAKVTRVEPSLQAAFVDYGGNRHGFLAFAEIHPDYYQIPTADRQALLEEERAYARAEEEEKERNRPVVEDVNDDSEGAEDEEGDIESVAEEDVSEEIRAPRKPRARRYKIQEVVKVRQIMLVQVVKEERGTKGAALTTYLSLAGRYCVLMPNTARGGGISRKITQAADRKKLKEIAGEMSVPEGAGLIIRTAGAKRTKAEIQRDYEYLMRLWEQIRDLTMKSVAPAPIYEEGDLIKRSIRDLFNREIEEVLVEGEAGYRTAKDFMRMIMPNHARQVVRYTDQMPLFARYQVESYLGGMFNPVVQLKSGGYIVIGVTEALVAIDVNSGRATKEGSIEETALKTNLEAAEEVARQLRLRDLAGLIVIDFIDMDERKNNIAVEKRMKDRLKTDRARIQVGRISGFGLMEMSRQRLHPGMLESTTQPCAHCHGTGLIRSDDSLSLQILRQLEEEGTRKRSKEVLLRAPVAVVNFLLNAKREHVAQIEARYGMAVRVEADPHLVSPDYSIEKFKTATRIVPEAPTVVSGDASLMGDLIEDEDLDPIVEEAEEVSEVEPVEDETEAAGEGQGKKKRRRRRRRRGGQTEAATTEGTTDEVVGDEDGGTAEGVAVEIAAAPVMAEPAPEPAPVAAEEAPKPKRTRTRRKKTDEPVAEAAPAVEPVAVEPAPVEPEPVEEAPKPKRTRAKKVVEKAEEPAPAKPATRTRKKATPKVEAEAEAETPPKTTRTRRKKADDVPAPVAEPEATPQPSAEVEDDKPKRRGWWSA
ncbi:Rne/Rng family ribonuclease [Falsirhodobacter halotolerans]|uniref:Rne/Rng family ribonuclease n=1 Tax=Falsirhodobacter halotolerans TaxID=1146892 RepID=UPI001FD1CCA1|nr:Rne/Rng family ribonuclease [Falsirhodobacter halotolerans]MCJ8138910.1 Rne/Rng family ribonuclease [Falsirhodobacter halotolerans]